MKPNLEVRQLSKKFGIKVKQMRIIQNGVYQVVTSTGRKYCLKRMPYPPVQLRWIDRVLQRIRRHSSIRMGWRNPRTPEGKQLYVKWQPESPPFVLIPWIKGSWPRPSSIKQMKAYGRLLAQFHLAGKQIKIPLMGKQNKLGSWYSYLREEQQKLQRIIRKAQQNEFNSPMDQMLQQHGNEIMEMSRKSLHMLNNSNYYTLCQKTKAALCHGDFGPTNMIRTKRGLYLIDFETLRLDLRSYDLYRAIFNACHENHWRFATARAILDGYQQISKLSTADYNMLKVLLRFPRDMCILIRNFDKELPEWKRVIEQDFPKTLTYEQQRSSFLKKLSVYAKSK